MSDFISDLEAELLAAARRRAARRRRLIVPRPRVAAVVALAAVFALVLAAVAVVRGLEPSYTGDEHRAPPGPGVTLTLPTADVAMPCPRLDQRRASEPHSLALAIFQRPQAPTDDFLSPAKAHSLPWLPADTVFPAGTRRAGPGQFTKHVQLIPVDGPRPGGCGRPAQPGFGVCLIVGGALAVRCFADEEIAGGRALALTGPGMVHGVAPNGVVAATLGWDGGAVTVPVFDNAFEAAVPLQAGRTIRVELEQADACRPSQELLDAVPALREGGWDTLPATAEDAMPAGGSRQWVRHLGGGEFDTWVVARCEDAERACLLAIYDEHWLAQPCGTATQISEDGAWWLFPVAGRLAVAGLAPHRATTMHVILDGRYTEPVPVREGVAATILPPRFGSSVDPGEGDMSGRLEMRFR